MRDARDTKLDAALRKVLRARARLKRDQGRIGRRNARRSFGILLGFVGKALDESYPLLPKVKRERKLVITPAEARRQTRRIRL